MHRLVRRFAPAVISASALLSSAHCEDGPTRLQFRGTSRLTANKKKKETKLDKLMLISGTMHQQLSKEISDTIQVPLADAQIARFNDGEVNIKIVDSCRGKNVFIIQPCGAPVSDSVMELLLLIATARRDGAKRVHAVIPYFGFKHHRHDIPQSTKYNSQFLFSESMDFAKMLQEMGVDSVVSVDLQRPGQGQEASFFDATVPVEVVVTTNLMVDHLIEKNKNMTGPIVVVAPNDELMKKAFKFRKKLGAAYPDSNVSLLGFVHKEPRNRAINIEENEPLGDINVAGANVIIVDDIIDSGHTIASLSRRLHKHGAKRIVVCASHGLFSGDASQKIEESPIEKIYVTNSLPLPLHPSGKIEQISLESLLGRVIWTEHFRNASGDEDYEIEEHVA